MTNDEIKALIATRVSEGVSLSRIQDELTEKGTHMTYMELRMLASEIESADWSKLDKDKPKKETPPAEPLPIDDAASTEEDDLDLPAEEPAGSAEPEAGNKVRGKTVVELSKLMKPGTVANGTVKFGSGVSADWFLDQTGRLGLSKTSGKPDETDIMEFQEELQKLFGN